MGENFAAAGIQIDLSSIFQEQVLQNGAPWFMVLAGFFLFVHFTGFGDELEIRTQEVLRRVFSYFVANFSALVVLAFIILFFRPEPVPFMIVAQMLLLFGVGLFIVLSELLMQRYAKVLNLRRGEKWVKEIDYIYLTIGAFGVLISTNRIDVFTHRFQSVDILGPLFLTTAIVFRFVKTRAEIGGWNKL